MKINDIPEPYRTLAIVRAIQKPIAWENACVKDPELIKSFCWEESDENHEFWDSIDCKEFPLLSEEWLDKIKAYKVIYWRELFYFNLRLKLLINE